MHHHDRGHHAPGSTLSRRLIIATAATVVFVIAELTVGLYARSLALVGDALHNFTDAIALAIALFAIRLEKRPATREKSFGYQRAGILAAFINSGTLIAFTFYIFVEAIARIRSPRPVNSIAMMITAAVAVVLNGAITFALRRDGRDDVNIRSAVLHMLGDAFSSAGIIAAAFMIRATGSQRWDPAVSLIIGALILWSSWGILRETVNLLLEGTPTGISPAEVTAAIAAMEGVEGVHHLHIWALGPSRPALSCHVMVGDVPLRSTARLLDDVTTMLHSRYRIVHVTIQFEFGECGLDDPYCIPYTSPESDQGGRHGA
jgi:cobalt-zinc-cadmium efflux system protein